MKSPTKADIRAACQAAAMAGDYALALQLSFTHDVELRPKCLVCGACAISENHGYLWDTGIEENVFVTCCAVTWDGCEDLPTCTTTLFAYQKRGGFAGLPLTQRPFLARGVRNA